MHKPLLKIGTLIAALTVILGAFAAHTLKAKLQADALGIFETAVRYQMYHCIAICIAAIIYKEFPYNNIAIAGKLFLVGIIFFSGSLYLLTFLKAINNTNFTWVGAITPLGGVAFIFGWLLLFWGVHKGK